MRILPHATHAHTHTHHTDISEFIWIYHYMIGSEPFFIFHTGWWLFFRLYSVKKKKHKNRWRCREISHSKLRSEPDPSLFWNLFGGEKAEQRIHFISENKNGTKTSACGCEAKQKQHSPVHRLSLPLSLSEHPVLCSQCPSWMNSVRNIVFNYQTPGDPTGAGISFLDTKTSPAL